MTAPESEQELAPSAVSARLVQAREAKGLSQKDVADQLFLTTTFIRYLDAGEFHKIPKPAFIKGYLRSYARVVELEGDDLVEMFESEQNIPQQPPRIVDVTKGTSPPTGFAGPIVQTGVIGLVGVLLVMAIVWWIASEDEPPPVVTSSPLFESIGDMDSLVAEADAGPVAPEVTEENSAVSSTPEDGETQATALVQPEAASAEALPANNGDSEIAQSAAATDDTPAEEADEVAEEIAQGVDEVQIERVREDGVHYITVYAGGESEMRFSFSDECWVEITDGVGARVYADLNRAGDLMTVYGTAPFDVLLGRASAVEMEVDKKSINLDRFATSESTARVRTARL